MNIVYLGNFRHSWCTEVHLAREFEGLGHRITRLQEPPGGAEGVFLRQIQRTVDRAEADLLVFQRTWGLPTEATDLWRKLEADGTMTASYHLDLYHGLPRGENIDTDPFWTTGWVATPDGNPAAFAHFAAHGVNHVWIKPGVVSDECADVMPGRYRPEFAHDVIFLGSYGYHEEWKRRPQLIDWLAKTYGDRFRRYGGDTNPGPIRGQDANDLYASCLVSVGDSCMASPETLYSSDRPWECVGRGGFLLYPRIGFVADEFADVPSIDFYEDYDELAEQINYYTRVFREHPAIRAKWTAEGAAWVHEHATYRQRLTQFLDTMGLG